MTGDFKVVNSDKIEMTLTMTETLGNWKALQIELNQFKWPVSEFHDKISSMIRQAEKHFYPETTK